MSSFSDYYAFITHVDFIREHVAKHFVHGNRLTPGMLNRVEAVIRCYDPCLSCSTHALGQMELRIQLHSAEGEVLDEVARP